MSKNFKLGDVVQLNGGGPVGTVVAVFPNMMEGYLMFSYSNNRGTIERFSAPIICFSDFNVIYRDTLLSKIRSQIDDIEDVENNFRKGSL